MFFSTGIVGVGVGAGQNNDSGSTQKPRLQAAPATATQFCKTENFWKTAGSGSTKNEFGSTALTHTITYLK